MLKEILLIAFVFGVGFLFLIPGPTQSPSTVSILKKNVTALNDFNIEGVLNSTGRIYAYDGLGFKNTVTHYIDILYDDIVNKTSMLRSLSGQSLLTGSHEFQYSTLWDELYGQEIYAVIGDSAIWSKGKYMNSPDVFETVAFWDGTVYTLYNSEAANDVDDAYPVLEDAADSFYVDMGSHYNNIYIDIAQPGEGVTLEAQYYNHTLDDWQTLAIDADETNNLSQSGTLYFTRPGDMGHFTITIIVYIPHRPPITFHIPLKYPIRLSSTTTITQPTTAYLTTPNHDNRLEIFSNAYNQGPSLSVNHKGDIIGGAFDDMYAMRGHDICLYGDEVGTPAFLVNSSLNYEVSIGNTGLGYQTNIKATGAVISGDIGATGCLQMRDSDDGDWTKCTTLAGVMTCVAGTC